MSDFTMPSLGADMESGTVVEWLVRPGSLVHKGDVIAVVETHKGAIEVEIFNEGVIEELVVKEGEEAPVGAVLARLRKVDEGHKAPTEPTFKSKPEPSRERGPEPISEPLQRPAPARASPPRSSTPGGRAKVSPAARRRAAERGIDADHLRGTGIDGSVTLADVEAAQLIPLREESRPPSRKIRRGFNPVQMRKGIAAAMSRSKRDIPHYYLTTTIDMGPAQTWLREYNAARDPEERLLPAVLYLRAAALALKEIPQLNGFWRDDAFRRSESFHIGWAVSLRGGGLIAPAIRDVDKLSIAHLMRALKDVVARARSGGLRSSELTDATFTVTSLGERGVESVGGIIYPPQVAILGLGGIVERPWVVDGTVAPRPLVTASLAADHRASDGHVGSLFLSAFARLMQERPEL
ncbi:MAG: dihydrolipoamide acetyltransferase family protein [Beijerinckiaceae bacterium]